MFDRIHVVDPDYRRRARISLELKVPGVHTEIYEDLTEFCQHNPHSGLVFAADESGCSYPEIREALRKSGTVLPVVVYANQPTAEKIVSAISSGALDYLEWPFNPQVLARSFRRLFTDWDRRAQQERLSLAAREKVEQLTPRERDVLYHLVKGFSNREIAGALMISPRTVDVHRGHMLRKLSAQSTSDAVRTALYAGLDDDFR